MVPNVSAPTAMSAALPVPRPARLAAMAQQADSLMLDRALPAILDSLDGSALASGAGGGDAVGIVPEEGGGAGRR